MVKNLHANAGDTGSIPGSGRAMEKEMVTYSTVLTWEIPGRVPWQPTVHRLQKSQTSLTD